MRSLAIVFLAVAACGGGIAPVPPLMPRAADIRVGKSDPDPGCRDLGPVEAANGNSCGGFGEVGTYEGAYNVLRNVASTRGANYVRMDAQEPPHSENGCFDNRYVIRGVAYLCPTGT